MHHFFLIALLLFAVSCEKKQDTNQEDLRENLQDYIQAFKNKDIDSLSDRWSIDASYINPQTGTRLQGRENIMREFAEMFANHPKLDLSVSQESLEILDDSHAIEQGTARVVFSDEDVEDSKYTIQYVKENNKWLIQHVTENDLYTLENESEELKKLDWLIGKWVDENPHSKVETNTNWFLDNHYIQSKFTLFYKGKEELSGEQLIGWDPSTNTIRSWIFDSDGGYGEGTWSNQGHRWIVHVKSVLPSGSKASSTHVYSLIDNNSYQFYITGREINGEILPNIEESPVIRKKSI